MQIFNNPSYDIVTKQKTALTASMFLVILGVIMIFVQGISLSKDFTGGAQIVFSFKENKTIEINDLRASFENTKYNDSEIKTFGESSYSLTVKTEEDIKNEILKADIIQFIESKNSGFLVNTDDVSISNISGKMSQEMIQRSLEAIEFALVLIALYIIVRFSTRQTFIGIIGFLIDYLLLYKLFFEEYIGFFIPIFVLYPIIFKAGFSFGALIAVFHDIIITLSILEIFKIELSASVIAALLTIIGYSLNDTIVVFDRIRENLEDTSPKDFVLEEFQSVVNKSINTTLNRTIVTSLTTFFVVFILSFFGGESLAPFAITLCIGVVVGTYSSVFIAAPIMMNRFAAEMQELKDKIEDDEKSDNPKNADGIIL